MDESELDLSCIGLVTAVGEVGEDGFGFVGDAWRRGDLLTAQADGCRSQRPQGLDYLLDREAGAGLGFTRDCESGEQDGHVGFDALADAMEDRPCCEVGFGHPERSFDLVEVAVGGDHAWAVHRVGADVCDVAFQPGQVAG